MCFGTGRTRHGFRSWASGPGLRWDTDERARERFAAWATGTTGYPLVDAGMRQLLAEGWMHNRVRMVTASFLVKDLHIDWRLGARWFMWHLVDGDLASNQHGWQWVAGTGTDAAPFHRVLNPWRQQERFDPTGAYVSRYVDELASDDEATRDAYPRAAGGPRRGAPRGVGPLRRDADTPREAGEYGPEGTRFVARSEAASPSKRHQTPGPSLVADRRCIVSRCSSARNSETALPKGASQFRFACGGVSKSRSVGGIQLARSTSRSTMSTSCRFRRCRQPMSGARVRSTGKPSESVRPMRVRSLTRRFSIGSSSMLSARKIALQQGLTASYRRLCDCASQL